MNENFESPVIPSKFLNRRSKIIHSEVELNNFIKSTILEWSKNDFPCPYAIQTYISQVIEPYEMKNYFTQCYNNVHSMREHINFIQLVNSHIWALFSCRPAVTFYDIFKLIEALCSSVDRNTLGPLKKVPIIKTWIFNNADIHISPPEIRLSDVILDCANFLTERISINNKRRSEEFVVNSTSEIQFLNYLKKKYNRYDFGLGVKITNFSALRDAAYAAKEESYHKLISSEKLTKLLKADVKSAIKNIREKLSADTKLFQKSDNKNNSIIENISQFANLSFQDALIRFFQPFLDEKERIFSKHNLAGVINDADSSFDNVTKLLTFFTSQELYGEIFQLSSIIGSLNHYKTQICKFVSNRSYSYDEMINLEFSQWQAGIFIPLMNDMNKFLYLSHSSSSSRLQQEPLKICYTDLIEKCKAISYLLPSDTNKESAISLRKIHNYKLQLLNKLADLSRIILNKYSNQDCLNNRKKLARLNIDLFPQLYNLILSILSENEKIIKSPRQIDKSNLFQHNSKLIGYIFKSKLPDFIRNTIVDINNREISMDLFVGLEEEILDLLQLDNWPINGESFVDYLNANRTEILQIFTDNTNNTGNTNNTSDNDAEIPNCCQCIGVEKEFIRQLIRQTPDYISLEVFQSQILRLVNGVSELNESSGRIVAELWNDQQLRQQHVLEDGFAPAIDIRMKSFLKTTSTRSGSVSNNEITNPDSVMRAISRVGMMENVESAMKWNEIYRFCWGDVSRFVNDHSDLARLYNVRLLVSELGVIRVNAVCSNAMIDDVVKQMFSDSKFLMGHIISVLIQGGSGTSSIQFCHLIDGLVNHIISTDLDKRANFIRFANSTIDLSPPELICEIITDLLDPMARRILIDDETDPDETLLSILEKCDETVILLLKINLAPNHRIIDIIKSIKTQTEDVVVQQINLAVIQSNTSIITANLASNQSNVDDVRCRFIGEEEEANEMDNLVIDTSEGDCDRIGKIDSNSNEKRRIVDDIRCNEFGVGLELKDDVSSKLVENFNNKMARLVEHLSNDLYANSCHFVLELVQNADDNLYGSHVRPKLDLVWNTRNNTELVLEVHNNELGFTESDLRSLCDIGASTKYGTNRTNKIGRKGIGFKSVFLISDQPEIHSNGFHVRFERYRRDKNNRKVSNNALVPSWCEEESSKRSYNNTTIKLPIIPTLTNHIRESVAYQMKPYLLLFLRNLTRISIKSCDDSDRIVEDFIELVEEESTHNHRVVLCQTGEKHSWFLRSKQMPILDLEMQKINPRNVSVTEITVAIPLNDQDLEDLPAFAFLPIRSYGLRFIVNADFSIPASREDISNECAWNKWLIEQISHVFAECLVDFIGRNRGEKQEQIIRILQCIPLPGEVPTDSSFHALIPKIRSQLVNLAWLPDRYGTLHAPCQLIIESVDDSCLTQVLCNRLNLTLLHPDISGCSLDRVTRVLNWLGCQSLSLMHLSKLLAALTPEDLVNQPLIKSIIIAIHNGLERESSSLVTSNRLIVQLSSMSIWPIIIKSGKDQYVSIEHSKLPIFLPPSHWNSLQSTDPYSSIRLVISPSFIASFQLDNNKRLNVATSLLQRLGVHELTSATMINYAIIPYLTKPTPPNRQWFITVAQYLLDQCHPSQYKENVLPLLSFPTISYTSTGQSSPTISPYDQLYKVHLSSSMESMNCSVLPILHQHIDYVVLDDVYLQSCSLKSNQWKEFFLSAGVSETFYKSSPTEHEHSQEHTQEHAQEQHTYPEIMSLLNMNDKSLNVDLLRYLDINWSHLSSGKYHGILSHFTSGNCIPVCASYDDLNQSDQLLDLSLPLRKSSETLFLSANDPNKQFMPESLLIHFPICPVMFSSPILPQRLGMIDQINIDQILSLLTNVFVDKSVIFSGKQSIDFYNWIRHNLSDFSLRKLIGKFKSILGGAMFVAIPNSDEKEPCDLMISQFCYWTLPITDAGTHKTVFLQDQQVQEDLRLLLNKDGYNLTQSRALVNLFPGLQEFFVDICGVREFPTVREIWPILENLLKLLNSDRLKELNNAEIELITDVYNIIRFLDQYNNGEHRSDILELNIVPCLSGNYRSIIDKKKSIKVFSWRSMETVHSFQQYMDEEMAYCPIDFVSFSLMTRETSNYFVNNSNRWTAAQFLHNYFNLPVLEDQMCFQVDNRENFKSNNDVKLMLAHLEVIVSQWFQRNVSRDGVAHCMNLLGSLTRFCTSSEDVYVSVSLREHTNIGYRYSENVYIGSVDEDYTNSFELLLGGLDLQLQGLEALNCIMRALISWILKGDRFNHLRERFKKFYRSLFDLIETSDHNHVSIFIRSHNLRINPSSIDYIFAVVKPFNEEEVECEPIQSESVLQNDETEPKSPLEISVNDNILESNSPVAVSSPAAKSDASSTNKCLKRKRISISVENVVPAKQICLDTENVLTIDNEEKDDGDRLNEENHIDNQILSESLNNEDCIHSNDTIVNQKSITFTTDLPTGRNSPLSLRLKEQNISLKAIRLSTSKTNPQNVPHLSGRIGEHLAYQKLTGTQRLGEWEVLRVDWVNQDVESRLPYDFKISARRSDSNVPEIIYLEVKATTQPNKLQFDLSPQEVTAAWSFKEFYHLLLVYHSGNYPDTNTKFVHIPDTLGQLQDNQCKLLLDVASLLQK